MASTTQATMCALTVLPIVICVKSTPEDATNALLRSSTALLQILAYVPQLSIKTTRRRCAKTVLIIALLAQV